MKKSLIVVAFVFVMSFGIYAMQTGGPARLAAMGSPEIVVVDSSNSIDLFENGFVSGIFNRTKENTINLYPNFDYGYFKTVEKNSTNYTDATNSGGGGDAFRSTPIDSGITIYPTNDFVILFRPYGYYNTGVETMTYTGGPTTEYIQSNYMYAGELAGALKLNSQIAVSLLGGYARHGITARYGNEEYVRDTALINLEYEASVSFFAAQDGGMSYAITAGNKGPVDTWKGFKVSPAINEYGLEASKSLLVGNSAWIYGLNDQDAKTLTFTASAMNNTMIHVNFGMSDAKKDGTGFTGLIGVKAGPDVKVIGYEIYRDIASKTETTKKIDEYTSFEGLYGAQGNFEYRVDLGDFITGAKLGIDWVHINKLYSIGENCYNLNVAGGVNFTGVKGLQVPFEIYYENFTMYDTQKNLMKIYDLGASLGTEISFSKEVALRFGADYGFYGEAGNYSSNPGTADNPFYTKLGLNAGVGLKSTATETNITIRFENLGNNPVDNYYKTFMNVNLKLLADVKFSI